MLQSLGGLGMEQQVKYADFFFFFFPFTITKKAKIGFVSNFSYYNGVVIASNAQIYIRYFPTCFKIINYSYCWHLHTKYVKIKMGIKRTP